MTKPKCTVNGVKNKGSMCGHIIVSGKLCGYEGECEHKEGHQMTNQYALGYKAGLEAAVKAWDKGYEAGINDERTSEANIGIAGFGAKVAPNRQNPYAALPVPDVQWCDWIDGTHEWDKGTMDCAAAIRARSIK